MAVIRFLNALCVAADRAMNALDRLDNWIANRAEAVLDTLDPEPELLWDGKPGTTRKLLGGKSRPYWYRAAAVSGALREMADDIPEELLRVGSKLLYVASAEAELLHEAEELITELSDRLKGLEPA